MIGVVVATHGKLAEEMIRTAEGVVGKLEQVIPYGVVATDPDCRNHLEDAVRAVDLGEGVVVLTDLLGGSPTNLCLSFVAERQVEVVTGVNLPMLLKLGSLRKPGKPVVQLAVELAEAGRNAIVDATEALRRRM